MRCHTHFTDEETKVQKALRLTKITQRRWSRNPCLPAPGGAQGCSPALPDEARGRAQGCCSCPGPRGGVRRAVAHSAALPLARRTALPLPRVPAAPPAALPGPQRAPGTHMRPAPLAALPEPSGPRAAVAPPPQRLRTQQPGTVGNERQRWRRLGPGPRPFPFHDLHPPWAPHFPGARFIPGSVERHSDSKPRPLPAPPPGRPPRPRPTVEQPPDRVFCPQAPPLLGLLLSWYPDPSSAPAFFPNPPTSRGSQVPQTPTPCKRQPFLLAPILKASSLSLSPLDWAPHPTSRDPPIAVFIRLLDTT